MSGARQPAGEGGGFQSSPSVAPRCQPSWPSGAPPRADSVGGVACRSKVRDPLGCKVASCTTPQTCRGDRCYQHRSPTTAAPTTTGKAARCGCEYKRTACIQYSAKIIYAC